MSTKLSQPEPAGLEPVGERYNEIFFESLPSPERHVDRLQVIARLSGIEAAPVDHARILEIGCGTGANLIPQAMQFASSEFVGVDLAERMISAARRDVESLGVRNLRFIAGDIHREAAALGKFDYIICHGVISWIPKQQAAGLLTTLRSLLRSNGCALVSYNSSPGWRVRELLRSVLKEGLPAGAEPAVQIRHARACLKMLRVEVADDPRPLAVLISHELLRIAGQSDGLLFHELIADDVHAFTVAEMAQLLSSSGLHYLGDAAPIRARWNRLDDFLPESLAGGLAQAGRLHRELIADARAPLPFRASVVSAVEPAAEVQRQAILAMQISSPLIPVSDSDPRDGGVPHFINPRGESLPVTYRTVSTLLRSCAEAWPQVVPLSGVSPEDPNFDACIAELLGLYGQGWIDLHVVAPRCSAELGTHPAVCGFARQRADRGPVVPTLRHEGYQLNDFERHLVRLLDGSRDISQLEREVEEALKSGALQVPPGAAIDITEAVAAALEAFREQGMLLPSVRE